VVETEHQQRSAAKWFSGQCEALARDGSVRSESATLRDIAVQASEPLRIAVVGAVSVGKSALVNALLGRELAQVAREEATSRVAWFRDPGLQVPPPLGKAHDLKQLTFPLSGTIVLIDTPGLDTASGNQVLTETMLSAKHAAAGAATALVLLVGSSAIGEGLRWVRRFAALNGGPFELHTGIVVAGSKADLYETGGSAQGSRQSREGLVQNLRGDIQQGAGHLVGHVAAVMPALSALARTEAFSDHVLAQIELVANTEELLNSARQGWPSLEEAAKSYAPALDVRNLNSLFGSHLGLTSAADLLVSDKPADPRAALRRLWLEISGLNDLESRLSTVAAAGSTLTITAVVRRLERLATRLGRHLGSPVRELLAQWHTHPLSVFHDRSCAALVLEGNELAYLPAEDRLAAVRLLRGEAGPLPREARARWIEAGASWQASSRDSQIIRMVLDLSLKEAGSTAS
jgi:50S ribosome-binding GTPase